MLFLRGQNSNTLDAFESMQKPHWALKLKKTIPNLN